ncbi:MAG: dTDP-4-dehydrorhamnose reductase [Anaerolineaceae bacterium]|nr:dTDP-4-dehydrorhamnose reductase [Anaerolineaceae bacterium]
MPRILLLGNTGQVGWELNRTLLTVGELIALDYPQIDMSNPDQIRGVVREYQPSLIVNATAYTDVDKAETEPELAMAINGIGPGILAEEAESLGAALIHYSTDFVFDGTAHRSYTEKDEPHPINVYGQTKLAGENAVIAKSKAYLIFRTSWVYSLRRPCFVTKVLRWARENETLRIVDDQVSGPTWARLLAEATTQIISMGKKSMVEFFAEHRGLYHLAGSGGCSRYDWAKAILAMDAFKEEQKVKELVRAKSADFNTKAVRPNHSTLDTQKVCSRFELTLPSWQDVLSIAMNGDE